MFLPLRSYTQGDLDLPIWSREDRNLALTPITGKSSPFWHCVVRRAVHDLNTGGAVNDEQIDHQKDKRAYLRALHKGVNWTRTDFHFVPQESHHTDRAPSSPSGSEIWSAPNQAGAVVGGKQFLGIQR